MVAQGVAAIIGDTVTVCVNVTIGVIVIVSVIVAVSVIVHVAVTVLVFVFVDVSVADFVIVAVSVTDGVDVRVKDSAIYVSVKFGTGVPGATLEQEKTIKKIKTTHKTDEIFLTISSLAI